MSSLLPTTERDKKLFVTRRESTIRETFKMLRYVGPCHCSSICQISFTQRKRATSSWSHV